VNERKRNCLFKLIPLQGFIDYVLVVLLLKANHFIDNAFGFGDWQNESIGNESY
jgi:hypothetical protein